MSEESLRYDMLRTAWHDAFVTIMIVLLFDVLPVAIANVFSVDNAKTQIALDKPGVSSNMHDVVRSSAP